MDASTVSSIKADLQSAIRSVSPRHSQSTYKDALHFLGSLKSENWLIIFDNADHLGVLLRDFFPQGDLGCIIITTRDSNLAGLAPKSNYNLKGMLNEEAFQILKETTRGAKISSDHESASLICEEVGNLPLALVQVVVYCLSKRITLSEYLKLFKERRAELMSMAPGMPLDKYKYSAYAALNLSYSLLSEPEQRFLHLISCYHSFNIPLDIFKLAVECNYKTYQSTFPREAFHTNHLQKLKTILERNSKWDGMHIERLLSNLDSLSLLSVSSFGSSGTIDTHPLIRSWARDKLSREDYQDYVHMAIIVLSNRRLGNKIHHFQHLIHHILEFEIDKVQIHVDETAAFGYILHRAGLYDDAIARRKIVRDQFHKEMGPNDRWTLHATYYMSKPLVAAGQFSVAEAELRQVVKSKELAFWGDDEVGFQSRYMLAVVLRYQYKFSDATRILRDLLPLRKQKSGETDYRSLQIHSELAQNLEEQDMLLEAENIYRKIIPVMEQYLDKDNPLTLGTSRGLGVTFLKQGRMTEAEDILEPVKEAQIRIRGKGHPSTLLTLIDLSICYRYRGDLAKAEDTQQNCLELQERIHGKDHPHSRRTRKELEITKACRRPNNNLAKMYGIHQCEGSRIQRRPSGYLGPCGMHHHHHALVVLAFFLPFISHLLLI